MNHAQIKPFAMNWQPYLRQAPNWFRDAKFGMFFHWGPYCVPAFENEWYSRNMYAKGLSQNRFHVETYGKLSQFGYKDFYPLFKGEKFDPDYWAELMVTAGAKYGGVVTEHADNFSLWDSKVNPVNAVNYGPKRDVVGELEKAIRRQGLNFIATFHHQWLWGWFMSSDPNADVYNPENEIYYGKALPLEANRYIPWRLPDDEFNRVWMEKVIEVIDGYDPDLIYFDSRANIIAEQYKHQLVDYYYNRNSRSDRIISYKQEDFPDGVGIVDIECGRFAAVQSFPWQTDDRLEALRTWCYVQGARYKPAAKIIHQLCDVVSKNGNLLLNVGPKADGSFADEAVAELKEVGRWLADFGEAIYGTRPFAVHGEGINVKDHDFDVSQIEAQTQKGVFDDQGEVEFSADDLRFTTKDNVLYVIMLGKPEQIPIQITSLRQGTGLGSQVIESIGVLGGAPDLDWNQNSEHLEIILKGPMPSNHANVIKISYRK
ncbi:MAG TPA: alpha-L-fucosidase [Firmicutes bacterium]|mgnify:FL=1|nr:alpha-L-fucosidase [Bacillota bacterium]